MRLIWMTCGLLALGIGIAGIVLPLVPTTGPVLLAAWCFARSSPRMHHWLVTHPRLGPPIRDWQTHRAIGRRAKWIATASIVATPVLSLALGAPDYVIGVQVAVLSGVTAFIWTRPDGPLRSRRAQPGPG